MMSKDGINSKDFLIGTLIGESSVPLQLFF